MPCPRVAAIHDMSGFGRCSLTVALPVLSAMGVQCCPLPTAFLSTHTGGFEGYTFLDMTDEMPRIADHWRSLGLKFDAVYSGFMGSERQMDIVRRFIEDFRSENTLVLVDPVMGDHGRMYRTYTPEMCCKMGHLALSAGLITPNLTEAAFLLGRPYESLSRTKVGVTELLSALSLGKTRSVVITGVSFDDGLLGAACYDADLDEVSFAFSPQIGAEFHGTGDLFASVLLGARLRGKSLAEASKAAVSFVYACALRTYNAGLPLRDGVEFEPLMGSLIL